MTRISQVLSLLLAVQLLIAAAVFWPKQDRGDQDARAAILALETEAIDRIDISDGDSSVQLARSGGGWILPEYFSLPVATSRVDKVLKDLPSQRRGWPVASSDSAVTRFEVDEASYQRRVGFYSADTLAGEIFLGSSPGFRKVHSRPGGDRQVYAIEFSSFELPTTNTDWLDKSLLQVDASITSLTGLDFRLTPSDGDTWAAEDGTVAAAEEVNKLINGLTSLRVTGAADPATTEMLAQMDVPANLRVSTDAGDYEFRLFEIEDAYYIQRSDIPVFFSISAFDHDRLNTVSAVSLFEAASEPSGSADIDANAEAVSTLDGPETEG